MMDWRRTDGMIAEDDVQKASWPARVTDLVAEYARIAVSVTAVAGFILVSIAYMGLKWFYGNFGLTPRDVGLNEATILFETASTGIITITVAALVGFAISASGTRLLGRRDPAKDLIPLRRLLAEPVVVKRAAVVALFLLVAYFLWGVVTANRSLNNVRLGQTAEPQLFAHGEVTGRCTEVWWKDAHLDPLFAKPQGVRLVYLGNGEGITVFFDSTTGHTIRVPSSDIATRSC
jgi:hypothetical protein